MADTGIKDISAAFERMKRAGQLKALRSSVNAALNPALKQLRAAAPKGSEPHKTYKGRTVAPGFLSRSVIKSTRVYRDKSGVTGNVRLRGEAWYGSLIEHGYRPGRRNRKVKSASRRVGSLSAAKLKELGDNRAKIQARPWFNPVINRVQAETEQVFRAKMQERIAKAFRG